MDLSRTKIVSAAKILPEELRESLEQLDEFPDRQLEAIRGILAGSDGLTMATKALERVVATSEYLEEMGSSSFEHPNGFDSIPLELNLPNYRVRLHIWWPDSNGVIEDVHNHAWDFGSLILCGSLRFVTFALADAGLPFFHYPYRFGEHEEATSTQPQVAYLRSTLDASLAAGTYYSFSHTQLHRVVAEGGGHPVATFVITGTVRRDGSDVYVEKKRVGGYRLLKHPFGAEKLKARLERLLVELNSA